MTSSSTAVVVHYPVVDENMTPKLGMHFDNLDEAYTFYNGYGKQAGFSIRKEFANRGKDGGGLYGSDLFVQSRVKQMINT